MPPDPTLVLRLVPQHDETPADDISLAERHYTEPAPSRKLPEHSRDPRAAPALLDAEMLLDGDPDAPGTTGHAY
jgi:hypothetical protein